MEENKNASSTNAGTGISQTGDIPEPVRERMEEIKVQRKKADSLYLTCKTLPASREVSLAVTCFQSARQNMGLVLGELGSEYPYKESMDPTTPKVNAQTDQGEVIHFHDPAMLGSIETKLADLRGYAGKCIEEMDAFVRFCPKNTPKIFVAVHQALGQLMNGKMWLGEELARRKVEALKQTPIQA